jgi:undecaprenyl-diphosphatase
MTADLSALVFLHERLACPFADVFFGWISQFPTFAYPLLLLILLRLAVAHGRAGIQLWLLLLLVLVVGEQLGAVLKAVFGHPRPCAQWPDLVPVPRTPFHIACSSRPSGMPSNHALQFFAGTAFLYATLRQRVILWTLGSISALVALSRVYLGMHYPSQVIAGAVVGIAYGLLVARLALVYLRFVSRLQPDSGT